MAVVSRGPKVPKHYRPYVDAALAAGWTLDFTSSGHPRLNPPRGTTDPQRGGLAASLTMPGTAYDGGRGLHDLAARLRRHGITPTRKANR